MTIAVFHLMTISMAGSPHSRKISWAQCRRRRFGAKLFAVGVRKDEGDGTSRCARDRWPSLGSFDGPSRMLDLGRREEAVPRQLAPGLEVLRAAEVHGVVLQRLPFDDQPITRRLLDRALQIHPAPALRSLEERRRLGDTGFELCLEAGLDL